MTTSNPASSTADWSRPGDVRRSSYRTVTSSVASDTLTSPTPTIASSERAIFVAQLLHDMPVTFKISVRMMMPRSELLPETMEESCPAIALRASTTDVLRRSNDPPVGSTSHRQIHLGVALGRPPRLVWSHRIVATARSPHSRQRRAAGRRAPATSDQVSANSVVGAAVSWTGQLGAMVLGVSPVGAHVPAWHDRWLAAFKF